MQRLTYFSAALGLNWVLASTPARSEASFAPIFAPNQPTSYSAKDLHTSPVEPVQDRPLAIKLADPNRSIINSTQVDPPGPHPSPPSSSKPSSSERTSTLKPTVLADSSQSNPNSANPDHVPARELDLEPKLINNSPVLQRWLRKVPNVQQDINRDPSFRTRLRLGYSTFPSTDQASGWHIGVEDIFLGRTGLTMSSDYQAAFNGDRAAWGAEARYYVRPLGKSLNLAPVVGYRHLETNRYSSEGLNVGLRLLLVLSRGGGADISVTQTWVAPATDREVGLTTLSFGYALTHNLRLSTDIQKQNARQRKDSRVGIGLEWML